MLGMSFGWALAVGMEGRPVACRLQETVRVLEVSMRDWSEVIRPSAKDRTGDVWRL